MANSFSISRFSGNPASDRREEIRAHTGCDDETSSILRSIERLGSDPSIRRYEISPTTKKLGHRGAAGVVWSVRAVRS